MNTHELNMEIARALLATFRPRMDVWATRIDTQQEADDINAWARERGFRDNWKVKDWKPVRRNRENVPLTVEAVARHVAGRYTAGFYQLFADKTSNSVSVDFDDHRGASTVSCDPREDLDALITVCLRRGVRFLANHSRGGRGYWLHLILPTGTPAVKGRAVMGALIREAGLRHIADGGTFDAIFPKQDDLRHPEKIGNLFCAPVCGRSLRADPGGSHFIGTDPNDLSAQLSALVEY